MEREVCHNLNGHPVYPPQGYKSQNPNLASLGADLGAERLPQSRKLLQDGGVLLGGEPARLQLPQVVLQLGQVGLWGFRVAIRSQG